MKSARRTPLFSPAAVYSFPVLQPAARAVTSERFWLTVIGIFSVAAVAAVVFVLTAPRPSARIDVSALPAINTAWNGTAAVLLVCAFIAIRRGKVSVHRALVLAAFASSTLFLTGYLIYHGFSGGARPYEGSAPWLYYPILVSHIAFSVMIVPLALVTLRRGWTFHPGHRTIARITLPIWLYVSVTGVVVYALLYGPAA